MNHLLLQSYTHSLKCSVGGVRQEKMADLAAFGDCYMNLNCISHQHVTSVCQPPDSYLNKSQVNMSPHVDRLAVLTTHLLTLLTQHFALCLLMHQCNLSRNYSLLAVNILAHVT